MPGIFGGLAGALGSGLQNARQIDLQNEELARQRRLDAQAQEEHTIRQAALLAGLHDAGIVPTNQEETQQTTLPDVGTIGHPGAERTVDTGVADSARYAQLGNSGYALDQQARTRPLVARERMIQSRVAFLRTRPEYKDADPTALRALAEDDGTFRETVKPQPGHNPVVHDTEGAVISVDEHGHPTALTKPDGTPYRPVPRRGSNITLGGGQPTPKSRAVYVQQRLDYYMHPKTTRNEDGDYITDPGMSRADAIAEANADADAVYHTHGATLAPPTETVSRSGVGSVLRGAPPNADYSTPGGKTVGGTLTERVMRAPAAGPASRPPTATKGEAPAEVLNQLLDQYGSDDAAIVKALKQMGYATPGVP